MKICKTQDIKMQDADLRGESVNCKTTINYPRVDRFVCKDNEHVENVLTNITVRTLAQRQEDV